MNQAEQERVPDPRTLEAGICGDTFTNPSGMEWVCIRQAHSALPGRNDGTTPPAESHRYIHRFAQPKGTK